MRLVLFDIDGTLISTGGAGMRAFYRAVRRIFGVAAENESIRPDGKTDPIIARELLERFGAGARWNLESQKALFECYLSCLEDEMSQAKEQGLIRILPGVASILEILGSSPEFAVGLVTGNLAEGARIKLEKAGLGGYFCFGGYGSDSEDRTELTRIGIQRGTRLVAPAEVEGAFVMGDTPFDIVHGHAAGAFAVAVASGNYGIDSLRPYNPDLLVADLTGADSIISFMRDMPPRRAYGARVEIEAQG